MTAGVCDGTWWNSGIQMRRRELLSLPYCLQHQVPQSGDPLLVGPEKIQYKPLKLSHLEKTKQNKKKQCILVTYVSCVVTL